MKKGRPAKEEERIRRQGEWRLLRADRRLTQSKLAHLLGVSLRTVQAVEGAELTPRLDTQRLFRVLKMSGPLSRA